MGKVSAVVVSGFTSPRGMSPTLGTPPARSAYPGAAANLPGMDSDAKFDDLMSVSFKFYHYFFISLRFKALPGDTYFSKLSADLFLGGQCQRVPRARP